MPTPVRRSQATSTSFRPKGRWGDSRTGKAALIRDAFRRLISGEPNTCTARQREAAGVLTAAGKTKWDWSPLQKVLIGWRPAGVRTYNREPLRDAGGNLVKGTWQPIISLGARRRHRYARKSNHQEGAPMKLAVPRHRHLW
ncbi:recombinase family protein [Pseudoclavibacter sp. RFBJ3]|uniref:recombinase family protein n=1 Tax=Pseudoclavibacter sp. RFBJ3 TaxID=2080579 RepID=UPI0035BE7642